MSSLYLRLLCLICLPLLASTASAQMQFSPDLDSSEEVTLPKLGALNTGWWGYFDPAAADAEQRHAAFIDGVSNGLSRLSPIERDEGERSLAAVENNLATYRELSGNPALQPESVPEGSAEYSFEQLLRVIEGSRVSGRLVADDERELNRKRRQLDSDGRARDQAFKNYISKTTGADRWLQGLRLVQARSQQALSELRLDMVEVDYSSAQQVERDFEARLAFARSRLVVPAEGEDVEKALARMVAAEKQVADAKAAYEEAELVAASFVFNDEAGKAEQRLLQHRSYKKGADFGLQEIVWMQIDAEYWLTRFYSDSRPSLSQHKQQELKWNALSREITKVRQAWKEDIEAEILLVRASPGEDKSPQVSKLLDARVAVATETLQVVSAQEDAQQDLAFTLDVLNEVAASRVSRVKRWIGTAYSQFLSARQWLRQLNATTLFEIGETPIAGNDVFAVFWIILIAVILSKSVRKGLARVGAETSSQAGLYTFGRLFHYFIIFVAILIALGSIGIDFSNLAFIAGALGVGIGFGLQNIVNNFVSGLIILFEGTLRVGDYIELDTGVTGTVKAIHARSTLIKTNDNIDIIVPNAEIASNKLTNWTLGEYILRKRIPFSVAYGTDKELVKKAAIEAANNVHFTLKNMKGRDPDVWLVEFGDSSMNYLLLVWVNRQGARRPTRTLATYLWALDDAFIEHGIEIPFPQRDLHLRSGLDKFPVPDENT
jgi:potassium efflux system protein